MEETFLNCTSLTSISLPKVSVIESYGLYHTFEGCTNLTSVTIPSTVYHIGKKAFMGTGLVQVRLPEAFRHFETDAFKGCYQLRKVELSERMRNSIRQYGYTAFPSGVEMVYY